MSGEAFNDAAKNPLNEKLIEAVSEYGCDRATAFRFIAMGASTSAQGNKPGEEGWTPLMYAITRHNEEVLKVLLHYSADPNVQNADGDTAAMVAIKHYKSFDTFRLARQMIREYEEDKYIDLDIRNNKGQTAIMIAAELGRPEFIERMMDAGANPFLRDNEGKWAFDYAKAQKDMTTSEAKQVMQIFEKMDADFRKSIEAGLPAERPIKASKPFAFKK